MSKKRYLKLSPDFDGFSHVVLPVDYVSLGDDYIRPWTVEHEVGDKFIVEIVEMSEMEFEALPEP